ncbi:retinol dehydrogenase 7-like [Octopus vulgaris]|uniref:Retinol dehydrogenase 7-like n=1 Tax=Octopus vulgaris TaxID=6645 RepID=A0AA36F5M5_OCTVU|nr:retinol dehydrogenase 7-like [Octopus vulgaris]
MDIIATVVIVVVAAVFCHCFTFDREIQRQQNNMMFSTIIDLILVALAVISIYLLLQWYLRTLTVTEFNQKYVLVTGCDTGFGYLLAKQLDVLGFNVFATCLTKEAISGLHAICTKRLEAFLMDVTKKEDIEKVEKFVRSRLPKNTGLWALVNNAGVMSTLLFPDCYSRKHYTEVMDVNVYGMIDVTTAFLPLLRMSKGRIVNVSSVLGKFTPPIFVPYCISKHAVEAYSNGLRCSLKLQNITVHIIEPGCFMTNLTSYDIIENRSRQDFAAASTDVQQFYGNKFFESYQVLVMIKQHPVQHSQVIRDMLKRKPLRQSSCSLYFLKNQKVSTFK